MLKNILKNVLRIITYRPNFDREGFNLPENRYDLNQIKADRNPGPSGGSASSGSRDQGGGRDSTGNNAKRPARKLQRGGKIKLSGKDREEAGRNWDVDRISPNLDENRKAIEKKYRLPENSDIIIREFSLGADPCLRAFMVYIDGMADRTSQLTILQNLMVLSRDFRTGTVPTVQFIMSNLLPGSQVKNIDTFAKVAEAVNTGDTTFFFEGSASALVVETKGWEHRGVDRPEIEQTITGPQEAFVENLKANTALIRKIIRSEKLQTELVKIGVRIKSDIAIMYISDLASPDLVAEVRRRITSLDVDYITDAGMLEQLIEDQPYNLNPQTLMTERPDRTAAALMEGRVAVLLSGSPFALVLPATMYTQLHTGEETYLRWQYGTFLRYIRTLSFYLALLLPGSYLAVVLYHQEMIPTELLLAIAGSRERVPFPTLFEIMIMEFSFELVREAGLRIPGIIGSTIGIVGALILGQAAVQANIVSPILVILVAVTGLASFSIPNYSLGFAVRIYRFIYIGLGALLGFYGITIGLFIQILLTVNLKSFGVPYVSPTGPRTYIGPDVVNRLPLFLHRRRPDFINPLDDVRASRDPRGWLKKGGEGDAGRQGG